MSNFWENDPVSDAPESNDNFWSADPVYQEKPAFIPQPADNGVEKIMSQATGEVIDAAPGTAQAMLNMASDSTFDELDSTISEEIAAQFEKQAAYLALTAVAFGYPKDGVADFVADRSRALASAQARAPENVKKFGEDWERASGFFESAGVMLDNLPVLGRYAITSYPNSIVPLVSTAVGAGLGGKYLGTASVPAGPVGVAAGTATGALAGGATGAFIGSTMVSVGAKLDEIFAENGIDTSSAEAVEAALSDKQLMETIKNQALRGGITQATVDALTFGFGGQLAKMIAAPTKAGKAAKFAADVAVESAGEFTGSAASQAAAGQDVNFKEASMEAVASLIQSTGQAGIKTTIDATFGSKPQAETAAETTAEPQPIAAEPVTVQVGEDTQLDVSPNVTAEEIAAVDAVPEQQVDAAPDTTTQPIEPDFTPKKTNPVDVEVSQQETANIEKKARDTFDGNPDVLDTDGNVTGRSLEFEQHLSELVAEYKKKKAYAMNKTSKVNSKLSENVYKIEQALNKAGARYTKKVSDSGATEFIVKAYGEYKKIRVAKNKSRAKSLPTVDVGLNTSEFDLAQIDSLIQASNKQKPVAVTREQKIAEINEIARQRTFGQAARDRLSGLRTDIGALTESALGSISTRLRLVGEKYRYMLRNYEGKLAMQVNKDNQVLESFFEKINAMPKGDRAAIDYAMKNSDMDIIQELAAKYGFEKEIAAVRSALDAAHERAKEVGFEVGFLENFFPRRVKDAIGLISYFEGTDQWNFFSKAINDKELNLGRPLSDEEKAEVINSMLRGFSGDTVTRAKPAALKERRVERVTPDIDKFYETSQSALVSYMISVNNAIEARRFFNVSPNVKQRLDEYTLESIDDTIAAFVLRETANENLTAAQGRELVDVLNARFRMGRVPYFWQTYKNLAYIDTMGSTISAVTQLGDVAYALYKNGVYNTVTSLARAAVRQSTLRKEDIGVLNIAAEFEGKSTSSDAVRKVFKFTGLEYMDNLGKETLINGALSRYTKMAAKPSKDFMQKLEYMFDQDAEAVVRDLRDGNISENVKLLLLNDLLDIQPAALSEMPEAYLKSGSGRVLYMLKSFTIKQIDIYRNEVFREIRTGNAAKGMTNLVKLASLFVFMNASADWLKDLLLGRDTPPDEMLVNNLLKLVLINKFQIYTAKEDGVGSAVLRTILPPVKAIDSAARDFAKAVEDGEVDVNNLRTVDSIPIAGKFYYWWFGGGAEKKERDAAKRAKEEGKSSGGLGSL